MTLRDRLVTPDAPPTRARSRSGAGGSRGAGTAGVPTRRKWVADLLGRLRRVPEQLGIRAQRKQAFEVADGRRIERDIGYALVRAAGTEAPDLVVFAEPGDMTLLGAHSLEGLNLKIDPIRKELVPAGPVITAAAA